MRQTRGRDLFVTVFNYDAFTFIAGADASLGTAFYLNGGGISSLTFGDVESFRRVEERAPGTKAPEP